MQHKLRYFKLSARMLSVTGGLGTMISGRYRTTAEFFIRAIIVAFRRRNGAHWRRRIFRRSSSKERRDHDFNHRRLLAGVHAHQFPCFMCWLSPMSANGEWTTISANEYQFAFERFGGSFGLHPRVVAIVASLARRPVRYAGLIREGALLAAVPLWGEHVVATKPALEFYGKSHLIDVGDSEIVLPVAEDAWINMPFTANMVSNLHVNNISNVKHETDFTLMLAKGLRIGNHRLSKKRQKERRRQIRRFKEVGGTFRPIGDFSADETATVYTQLFEKRWGFCPIAKDLLPTVLQELKDMLCGDV